MNGSVIELDDNGGFGNSSRIETTLPSGTYTIEATTFSSEETGSFSLALRDDTEEIEDCDDEIDNDGDGYIDCNDYDCNCNSEYPLPPPPPSPPSPDCNINSISINSSVNGSWSGECGSTNRPGSYYEKGVVYTTSKELTADFLRDRLIMGQLQHPSRRMIRTMLSPGRRDAEGLVMRGLDTAIVDEADSVLIDEAVTPLIISRAQENRPFTEACQAAMRIAGQLVPGVDYHKDIRYKEINFTKDSFQRIEHLSDHLSGIWRSPSRREELN